MLNWNTQPPDLGRDPGGHAVIGGLVIAGGEGRRFGGPKQLALLGGKPLIEWSVEAMLAVSAIDSVVVVLGANADAIRGGTKLGVARAIVCDGWREGMAASLRRGICDLRQADVVAITLADQPLITSDAIAAVISELDSGTSAARATYHGRPGHPVAIRRSLFSEVCRLRGDVGAKNLLSASGAHCVECSQLCSDRDVDSPEELERMQESLDGTKPDRPAAEPYAVSRARRWDRDA
jgi:CTP:molybdopterin cytidylyltransferase MocA